MKTTSTSSIPWLKPGAINGIALLFILFLITSCTTAAGESPETGYHAAEGEPIELIIPPYPAWPGESPETGFHAAGTRTEPDETDPRKTKWMPDDKIWIKMWDWMTNNTYTGSATYTGRVWNTDLRWPVGVTSAYFEAIYIGDHIPDDNKTFTDTDILSAITNSVSAGDAITFNKFFHQTNRITLTAQSLKELYLSGLGFGKCGFNKNYRLTSESLGSEYLSLTDADDATTTTVYLAFDGDSDKPKRLYRKISEANYALLGNLNLLSNNGTYIPSSGHTYTINLDAEGAITPEGMNEEQEKAHEKQRFLAWVEECRNGIYDDFILGMDIDLSEEEDWVPVNLRGVTFDGDNLTISGLEVTRGSGNFAGLFGYIGNGAIVKDLHVRGSVNVSDAYYVGGIAGQVSGSTLESVFFTGEVTGAGSMYTGGIAGVGTGGSKFRNCHYTGTAGLLFLGDDYNCTIEECSPIE